MVWNLMHCIFSLLIPPSGWSLEGSAPYSWMTEDLSKTGVIGDSRESTSSLGKEIENLLVDHWTRLLISLMESNWPIFKKIDH